MFAVSRTGRNCSAKNKRDLFDNTTDIIFTMDLSGYFLDGDRAVERLLGYTVEQAKKLTWGKLVAPDDAPNEPLF